MRCRFIALAAVLVSALTLSACAGNQSAPSGGAEASASGFPMTFDNCGYQVTIDSPRERIFSIHQEITETVLSLGLGQELVGAAIFNENLPEALADEYAHVEPFGGLSQDQQNISPEGVLEREPDLIVATWDIFDGQNFPSRDDLAKLGVATYVSPSECTGVEESVNSSNGNERVELMKPETIYGEVEQLAAITGHPDRGAALVDDLKAQLDEATSTNFDGVTAVFWYADQETPFVAGCCGASGLISNQLGIDNLFDDTKQDWPQVGWEAVAARDPEVLIITDLDRGDVFSADAGSAKIEFLESNPVTKEMTAVKNKNYIMVRGTPLSGSSATFGAAVEIAEGLRRLGYGG